MSEDANYRVSDEVAIIVLDNPPVNSLSAALRHSLAARIRHANARDDIKAIVLLGTNGMFCGGAEIREFNTPAQAALPRMPELIEGCDRIGKPLIAAIAGVALGAGLELALACHHRIATPDARLGLPEVKFGFLPGAGGTQRLPRLVNLPQAAQMMLSGDAVDAREAQRLGLVDAIVEDDLLEGALAFARARIVQGGELRRTRDLAARMQDVGDDFFAGLRKRVAASAQGNVAKLHIVDCCLAASTMPFDAALQYERERFLTMLDTPESKALRHVFFAERQAARPVGVAANAGMRRIGNCAVIGAGTMGSGIAMCFANAGIPVALIDANAESLERGMGVIRRVYAGSVAKGRMTPDEMDRRLGLVSPSLSIDVVARVDIVVEAVFERMDLKQQIFRELDRLTAPGTILATNTSMLDIDEIAKVTSRAEDVIGMHFFAPPHVMRLLEVVQCERTSGPVLASVMHLARKLGKAPVLSRVCDGFIGNRMLQRYGQQSLFLLDEGCTPEQIDRALQQWGMSMGPFAVGDLSGLDIGWSIRKRRYVEDPEMVYSRAADRICEAGRLGQKSGKGWYRYESGNRTPLPDPQTGEILAAYRAEIGVPARVVTDEEIVSRMILALVNEGANILAEGVAQRASDIDVVYTTGYGFPPSRGGPMYYANALGPDRVLAAIETFQRGYQGAQWLPSPLLLSLAGQGLPFA
jgi:3-hydroxyacyl-CoA dehydrogenase